MLFYAEYLHIMRRCDLSLDVILATKDASVFPFHKPTMARVKVTSIASKQLQCPSLPRKKHSQECK